MQSTDIGCKGNLFQNKMVGSRIIVVPTFNINQALTSYGENGRNIVSGLNKKKDCKNLF